MQFYGIWDDRGAAVQQHAFDYHGQRSQAVIDKDGKVHHLERNEFAESVLEGSEQGKTSTTKRKRKKGKGSNDNNNRGDGRKRKPAQEEFVANVQKITKEVEKHFGAPTYAQPIFGLPQPPKYISDQIPSTAGANSQTLQMVAVDGDVHQQTRQMVAADGDVHQQTLQVVAADGDVHQQILQIVAADGDVHPETRQLVAADGDVHQQILQIVAADGDVNQPTFQMVAADGDVHPRPVQMAAEDNCVHPQHAHMVAPDDGVHPQTMQMVVPSGGVLPADEELPMRQTLFFPYQNSLATQHSCVNVRESCPVCTYLRIGKKEEKVQGLQRQFGMGLPTTLP